MNTTLKCAHCSGDLAPGDGYCAHCGVVVSHCLECGAPLLPGATSCPGCSAPVDPAVFPAGFSLPPTSSESVWADLMERLRRATLGEFEIGRELGRGGMAAVFLAHELSLDRQVAIKVMSPGLLLGEGMVDRFRHEAITIAHLHHPNIVSVYSVRHAEGLHFFVMQYVQGRSLDQIIHEAGRLPLPIVRSILHQVGSALAYAHRRRVVHRDIKPGNILIDTDGNAVVTDFGIAKAAESPTQTMTGALVGTPAYMSPEQCRGGEVSGATDQYALGAVAYEMLTGEPPFSGSTYTVLQAHVEEPPRPLCDRLPDCPPQVEAAILRMLAKDPADRWPRIGDATAAIGAEPLTEDDPLRQELTRLATGVDRHPSAASLPPSSLAPPTRPSHVAPDTPGPPVGSVAILPPPVDLEVGDSFALVAMVKGQRGTRLPTGTVTWTAEPPGVLRFESRGGTAVAVAVGSTVLTATCRGVRADLRVEVTAPRADEITIEPPEHGVRAGEEIHLEATVRDKRGRLVTRPVAWVSADPATATVTDSGALLAQSPGLARITATLDAVRASIVIPILPARVAAIHIGEHPDPVVGDTFVLPATPVDRWGTTLPDRTVLWSSSDVRVAVVAAGGQVHALRPGAVVLTASAEGISEQVRISIGSTVVPAAPAAAAPAPEPRQAPRRRGRRRRGYGLTAAVLAAGIAAAVFWVLERPRVAAETDADTTASRPAGYVSYGARDSVVPSLVAITRRPTRSLRPAGEFQLAAEVRDAAGEPVPGAGVVWVSSDSSVVWVDRAKGRLRAMRPGRAHVVATSGAGRDSTPILVRRAVPAPAAAALSIAPVPTLRVGESATLEAVHVNGQGAPVADSTLRWASSDPAVASVDAATGEVRAHAAGTTVVTLRSSVDSTTAELLVQPPAVAGVIIQGARPLAVGERLSLLAIPTDQEGHALRDRPIAWTSSDTSVLQIDSETGLVAALSPGSVDVTATSEGGSGVARVTVFGRDGAVPAGPEARPGSDAGIMDGVDECYGALVAKDADRVARLYRPASRTDEENLKKLRRILRTREWSAIVGERVDGEWVVGAGSAAADFTFRLTWKDDAGARRNMDPMLRAEFVRQAGRWTMASCRLVGTPDL